MVDLSWDKYATASSGPDKSGCETIFIQGTLDLFKSTKEYGNSPEPIACKGAQGLWQVPPGVLVELLGREAAARAARGG